jgi:hypothetical protein
MPATELPDADALLASLLSMMTKFSCLGCPQQALLIQRELKLLQGYPDQSVAPLLKGVARRLEHEWQQLHFAIADDPVPVASPQRLALH